MDWNPFFSSNKPLGVKKRMKKMQQCWFFDILSDRNQQLKAKFGRETSNFHKLPIFGGREMEGNFGSRIVIPRWLGLTASLGDFSRLSFNRKILCFSLRFTYVARQMTAYHNSDQLVFCDFFPNIFHTMELTYPSDLLFWLLRSW